MDKLEKSITAPKKIDSLNHLDQIGLWKILIYSMQRDLALHQMVLANTNLLDNQKRLFQDLSSIETDMEIKERGPPPDSPDFMAAAREKYWRMVPDRKPEEKQPDNGTQIGGEELD